MAIRFFALVCLFVCSPILLADDLRLLQQAKAYLADPSEKLAESLVGYQGNVDEIIEALRAQMPRDWRKVTGILDAEHFEHPELKNTYKEDLLYFYVPDDYDGSEPFALMIFLHGGGEGTKREHAQAITALPEQFKYSYDLRRYVEDIPVITVAPSAPVAKTSARWCTVEAERYLVDVIRECHFRFNVDIDRVFLGGHSMGGMGTFHLCQRLSDRLAGGFISAGCWATANWSCMAGTPLVISHGAADAVAPGTPNLDPRPRYTDVFFARTAHTLLDQARVEHVYCEHPGGHSIRSATTGLGEFVKTMTSAKRDPFSRRIVAMTHRGWQGGQNKPPLKHNKWITINETAEGRIPFDRVVRTGPSPSWTEDRESFLQQGFKTIKVDVPCSRVEASYQDGNVFDVMTTNVKEFSLWLHPKMVDFSRPITVRLNGRTLTRSAKPSLLDALRSYHRYRDWGLVYHCELKLSANERAAETSG